MRVKDCGDYMIQLQDVEKRINSMVDKTDVEEMQTQILAHMLKRDKKILLYQREPLPRKMKKLEYTLEQIEQMEKDKLSYMREIKES